MSIGSVGEQDVTPPLGAAPNGVRLRRSLGAWWVGALVAYPVVFGGVYFVLGWLLSPLIGNLDQPAWAWLVLGAALAAAFWGIGRVGSRMGAPSRLWVVAVLWGALAFWPLLKLFMDPWPPGLDADTVRVGGTLALWLLAGAVGFYVGQCTRSENASSTRAPTASPRVEQALPADSGTR